MIVSTASPANTRALEPFCGRAPLIPTRYVRMRLRGAAPESACSVIRRDLSTRYAAEKACWTAPGSGAAAVRVAHCSA